MEAGDSITPAASGARWRWWGVLGLLFLLLITPGPERSLFSGVPFSSRGLALFVVTVLVAVFSALFPPRSRARTGWLFVLATLVVLKVLLSWNPAVPGWRAYYSTVGLSKEWSPVRFQSEFFTVKDHRVDRSIDFDGPSWGLHFVNDYAAASEVTPVPRDEHRPLRVRWFGYFDADREMPFTTEVSAAGTVSIRIDDGEPAILRNPRFQPFERTLAPGSHTVVIDYEKPPGERPRIFLATPRFTVTPWPAAPGALASWAWRSRAAVGVSFLALLVIAIAFIESYAPISRFVLLELWLAPKKLGAILFFAYFAGSGVLTSVPMGPSTVPLLAYNDWIIYEGQARQVVFNGVLMTDERGTGAAFYHYPLYPYMLAAAHLFFGEEFASVVMFNYLCLAAVGFGIYFLVKRYVTGSAAVVVFLLAALFLRAHHIPYAQTAFSDNLYILIVMVTVAVAAAAFEKRSGRLIWLTGVLSALAAATRPSFLLFPPFFACALLANRELGHVWQRARQIVTYSVGFVCGVAPFTIRNWLVSQKFVLLVSSFIMLPYFLYAPEEAVPSRFASDSLIKSLGDFVDVWRERPLAAAWVEARKILFTLGLTSFGPAGLDLPRTLVIWPILFAVALWFGRIPRAPRWALLTFCGSHIAAMVVGAPWTYGYKTILPFHLALLVGSAFLLPRWGVEWWRERVDVPRRLSPARPTVSVVLPTYNEKDSIREVIQDFFATNLVSEVLVINNNAAEGTSEQVAGTGAREIFESRQGYGSAIRRGLVEARGDLIVVCEPDGTFLARDIAKLIAFADDFDVVYGSRTSQQFIWHGANMGVFLRWGNWAVAKYMEFLYNATSLTDVGCTMRLLRRDVAERLRDKFRIDGSQFGPEMMVLTLKEKFQVIQVPVNYLPRVGESAVTGDPAKALLLGLQMIWLITSRRFEGLGRTWWRAAAPVTRERTS